MEEHRIKVRKRQLKRHPSQTQDLLRPVSGHEQPEDPGQQSPHGPLGRPPAISCYMCTSFPRFTQHLHQPCSGLGHQHGASQPESMPLLPAHAGRPSRVRCPRDHSLSLPPASLPMGNFGFCSPGTRPPRRPHILTEDPRTLNSSRDPENPGQLTMLSSTTGLTPCHCEANPDCRSGPQALDTNNYNPQKHRAPQL